MGPETKIYSEFFTNLAVAWFSGGIIAPFFSDTKDLNILPLMLAGVSGAFVSLKLAEFVSKGGKI